MEDLSSSSPPGSVHITLLLSSAVQAMARQTVLAAAKSFLCLLILTGSLVADINNSVTMDRSYTLGNAIELNERFPHVLRRRDTRGKVT
ncbi:hypothetical protein Ahy_A01g001288 [Arachis hypogaea]|uniref:Uncharacterized protein n=1 Tax=Arachis hypogaea TaxID=3818 RepID=A0A445EMQ3_ARAHY|nr:hypothetical protein Ahy_A01g001288 [Arachis hypogaea]